MKFSTTSVAIATMGLTSATAIKSNTPLGQKLLSSARRLDGYQYQYQQGQEVDYSWVSDSTWIANYSLKFHGCHTTPQWNEDANDQDDVKLTNLNLVRFRLCPSDTCSNTANGCNSGYGDYIVSMDVYLQAYLESEQQDGDYNAYQQQQQQGEQGQGWDIMDMVQCQQLNGGSYYTGPYCSGDGSSIRMGVFADDTCSNLVDVYGGQEMYTTLTGTELPYAESSLIGNECMVCKEGGDANYNGQQDGDSVKEACETLYLQAGKCEQNLNGAGGNNNNACQFMEGINMIYKNGGTFAKSHSSTAAGVFIGLFGCSFVLLSTYAYYLKSKLDRAKIQLIDDL